MDRVEADRVEVDQGKATLIHKSLRRRVEMQHDQFLQDSAIIVVHLNKKWF